MILGAFAALILNHAAVAAVIGLFLLVRCLGVRLGGTLNLLLVVVVVAVVALSVVAWLAGSRLDLRLAHDIQHTPKLTLTESR